MVTMENAEEVMQILERYTRLKQKEIPKELDDYLQYVAKTGDTVFSWSSLKYLFREKLLNVIKNFHDSSTTRDDEIPNYPNVDPFNYENMKSTLLERLEMFNTAPFTVQRLCELLIDPKKQYSQIDKFMRALEKNILVVSAIDPGRKRTESENGSESPAGETMLNGDVSLNVHIDIDSEMETPNGKAIAEEAITQITPDSADTSEDDPINTDAAKPSTSPNDIKVRMQTSPKSHRTDDEESHPAKKARLEINEEDKPNDNDEQSKEKTPSADDGVTSASEELAKEGKGEGEGESKTPNNIKTEESAKPLEEDKEIISSEKLDEKVEVVTKSTDSAEVSVSDVEMADASEEIENNKEAVKAEPVVEKKPAENSVVEKAVDEKNDKEVIPVVESSEKPKVVSAEKSEPKDAKIDSNGDSNMSIPEASKDVASADSSSAIVEEPTKDEFDKAKVDKGPVSLETDIDSTEKSSEATENGDKELAGKKLELNEVIDVTITTDIVANAPTMPKKDQQTETDKVKPENLADASSQTSSTTEESKQEPASSSPVVPEKATKEESNGKPDIDSTEDKIDEKSTETPKEKKEVEEKEEGKKEVKEETSSMETDTEAVAIEVKSGEAEVKKDSQSVNDISTSSTSSETTPTSSSEEGVEKKNEEKENQETVSETAVTASEKKEDGAEADVKTEVPVESSMEAEAVEKEKVSDSTKASATASEAAKAEEKVETTTENKAAEEADTTEASTAIVETSADEVKEEVAAAEAEATSKKAADADVETLSVEESTTKVEAAAEADTTAEESASVPAPSPTPAPVEAVIPIETDQHLQEAAEENPTIDEDLPSASEIVPPAVSSNTEQSPIASSTIQTPTIAINDQPMDAETTVESSAGEEVVMAETSTVTEMATDSIESSKDEPSGMEVDDTSQEAMDQ